MEETGKKMIVDFGSNPFVGGDFKIKVRKTLDFNKLKYDGGDLIPTELIMEQERYVKMYCGDKRQKKKDNEGLEYLTDGLPLFMWIAMKIEAGSDYVFLDKKAYMKAKGITSDNTYRKALYDICCRGVITPVTAKGARGYYWINPRFFFCGSRVNKYPDNVEEYKPKK